MAAQDRIAELSPEFACLAQDHYGFTHQDPGFLDERSTKSRDRAVLPAADANCLLSVMDHCLRSRHYVNVVVAGKHPAPQWLSMDAAIDHCSEGIGIWQWASNDQGGEPDVVHGLCGGAPTLETWRRCPSCASSCRI